MQIQITCDFKISRASLGGLHEEGHWLAHDALLALAHLNGRDVVDFARKRGPRHGLVAERDVDLMLPGHSGAELHLECAFRHFSHLCRDRVAGGSVDRDFDVLNGSDDVG